jgi:hypothetical protein
MDANQTVDMKQRNTVVIYFFFILASSVIGTLANLLIIASIILNKKLIRNPAYLFILNIGIADLGVVLILHSKTLYGKQ